MIKKFIQRVFSGRSRRNRGPLVIPFEKHGIGRERISSCARRVTAGLQEAGYKAVNARTSWDAGVIYGYGTDTNYEVRLTDSLRLNVRVQNAMDGRAQFAVGDKVGIDVPPGAARMLVD